MYNLYTKNIMLYYILFVQNLFMWAFKLSFLENNFPQFVQEKSFFPVWTNKWSFSLCSV